MRWDSVYDRFDACYHVMKSEGLTVGTTKLYIRFMDIGQDVSIHIDRGSDFKQLADLIDGEALAG